MNACVLSEFYQYYKLKMCCEFKIIYHHEGIWKKFGSSPWDRTQDLQHGMQSSSYPPNQCLIQKTE